jgi:hypothetical protein
MHFFFKSIEINSRILSPNENQIQDRGGLKSWMSDSTGKKEEGVMGGTS